MWTAKRVLILMGGLLITLSSYAIYTLFLGGIDNLPPLPIEYLEDPLPQAVGPISSGNIADEKLEMAFGANCDELRRPYRLWLPEKGIALATGQVDPDQSDGRVRLAPFSVATFQKSKTGGYPEISTIRSEVAFLTLDKPVSSPSQMTGRKVIKVELQGKTPGITIGNNRRTAEKGDDVDILITNGSLFYEERRNLIWTDGVVRLTDYQSKPPITISGKGLEMILGKETSPNRPRSAKVQPASNSNESGGIERIILRHDVVMNFWVDSRSGFLTGSQDNKQDNKKASSVDAPPAKLDQSKPINKAQIHIKTGGLFVYDLTKESAWFESPHTNENKGFKNDGEQIAPDQVHVERVQTVDGKEKLDQLTCDRLDLQFRRKADGTPGPATTPDGGKEIETAIATARPGNDVVIALDSERMAAYGNYLFFRAGDAQNGAQTILKGEPLRSVKDGNRMVCKELKLVAANSAGEGQSAEALGPGQIDMLDSRSPDKDKAPSYPTHVLWRDKLIAVKDKEGNQVLDLMKLYGEASFIDEVQKQELHGERIYVWLINLQDNNTKVEANGGSRQELHRVLAQDRVRARSLEFVIRNTHRLTMAFIPEIARDERLPEPVASDDGKAASSPAPAMAAPGSATAAMKGVSPAINANAKSPSGVPASTASQDQKKPAAPIELQANEVTVAIATFGVKKQLQELIAKGNVFVYQAGEKPNEKRVDIQGQLLTLRHAEKGDTLVVHGDPQKLARLELGEMTIWGPLVTINQADNRADVDGNGAMEMPSNKNLDGSSTNQSKRVTIHWHKSMTFDGKEANFYGGVQAAEKGEFSQVKCENMTAIFDRVISFKDGQKDKDSAKIDHVICDKNVYIDNVELDVRKQLAQRSIMQGAEFFMDNQEGPTKMSGPGRVLLLAQGSSDLAAPPTASSGQAIPGKTAWQLTRIEFPDRMWSNTKASTKNARFFANPGKVVEVYHFPTIKIDDTMNPDNPPKDGFYLQCEILNVEGEKNNDGKTSQKMIAQRNVFFKTDIYTGRADLITYNEATQVIVFEALNGNVVRLFERKEGRMEPTQVNSTKVLYNRKTGEMRSSNVKSISN